MSDTRGATECKTKWVSEAITHGFNFTPRLIDGELLQTLESVTVVEERITATDVVTTDGNLTLQNEAINTDTFTNDEGFTIAIGAAVQAKISGGTSGITYYIDAVATTDAGNTRTLGVVLHVRE